MDRPSGCSWRSSLKSLGLVTTETAVCQYPAENPDYMLRSRSSLRRYSGSRKFGERFSRLAFTVSIWFALPISCCAFSIFALVEIVQIFSLAFIALSRIVQPPNSATEKNTSRSLSWARNPQSPVRHCQGPRPKPRTTTGFFWGGGRTALRPRRLRRRRLAGGGRSL